MKSKQTDYDKLRECLAKLISWMSSSANSPISLKEASLLLQMLEVKHG